jgi:hypothetical protein
MYIKICPSCHHKNPEFDYNCQRCKYFLGDVEPVTEQEADTAEEKPREQEPESTTSSGGIPEQEETFQGKPAGGHRTTDRYVSQPMLSIEYAGRSYPVESGSVMGKADATSTAELQIPGLPTYIHRRHCCFDFTDNQWQVTAIENEEYTNPTKLNGSKIPPNQHRALQNGDRLTLCDITFQVRIIS